MDTSHLANNDTSVEASKSVDQGDSRQVEGPKAQPPQPPKKKPNGGIQAWLQVVGSFILYLNTWGECLFYLLPSAALHMYAWFFCRHNTYQICQARIFFPFLFLPTHSLTNETQCRIADVVRLFRELLHR